LSNEGRNKSCADLYNNIGHIHVTLKNFDTALNAFQKAASLYDKIEDDINVGRQLANIGTVYRDKQKFDLALDYYQQAKSIFKDHRPACYVDIADQDSNIGYILVMQKKMEKAFEYFKKAKSLYHELGAKQKENLVDINIKALLSEVGKDTNERA
jgi:tetratricopeptide (TPR) repeat protein